MASQVFSGDPGSLTTGAYVGDNDADEGVGISLQPGGYQFTDDEANQGAYGEQVGGDAGDHVGGAQMLPNAAQPGSPTAPGQPEGSPGGGGSTGIVGDVING